MNEIYKEQLEIYQKELKELYESKKYNELSFRTPLENCLKALKPKGTKLIQEAQSEKNQGHIRPDFKVYKTIDKEDELSYENLIGFVECKNITENLNKHIKSSQLDKYLSISPNIILTNYKKFILFSFDKIVEEVELFNDELDANEDLFDDFSQRLLKFKELIEKFFNDTHTTIKTKDEFVKILSSQSFYLSYSLNEAYKQEKQRQEAKNALIKGHSFYRFFQRTFDTFKGMQKIEFSELDFCDIIAQSIVYGMFVSFVELEQDTKKERIATDEFIKLLPSQFKTLIEFIYFALPSFDIPKDIVYVLENVKKTLALIDKSELCKMLNTELEDICIYLYEDFLKSYDELRATQKRKEGGVFYTPKEVVEMIVSSLHTFLKDKFNKSKGFADEGVKVLDFATGTGSFLACVFEKILKEENIKALEHATIKDKFLKDIYGFELSFVAYIVARLKLSLILKKRGFTNFDENDLKIFLNNTLDLENTANHQLDMPLEHLDEEWKQARDVKYSQNLLVILGNPPYNVKSKNKGKEILDLLQSYKEGLNETKLNLDDDYIKFIRFAQWKLLEQQRQNSLFEHQKGLLGFITNNSFLSGRTHRKMRESLYKSFDEIYILNLHGSDKEPKEDKNIFDIRVGVCISLFVKYKEEHSTGAKLYYHSSLENQIFSKKDKLALLNELKEKGLKSIKWQELTPQEPYFWFVPKNLEDKEYENFWALAEDKALGDCKTIFENFSSGISALRDKICIHLNINSLKETLENFKNLEVKDIREKYQVTDSRDWGVERAKQDVKKNQGTIQKIAYRPFDFRYTYMHENSKGFLGYPCYDTMQHFLWGENLGLCFPKTTLNPNFDYGLALNTIADRSLGGKNTGSETYIAPLYRYESTLGEHLQELEKVPNFTQNFKDFCKNNELLKDKSPEDILAFIYANLFNPNYRKNHLEYLKSGFPRINFEVDLESFNALIKYGKELLDLHLFKTIPQDSKITLDFLDEKQKQSLKIEAVKERWRENKLYLNENLVIKGVSKEIMEFKIGGYEVIKSFLKYRKDYEMSKDETMHLLNICKVLEKTLALQKNLEEI
ncbi:type ISP restriction/modification enzyme [Campylobacter cuniculorum]|uniref:site-specific DNA-methyltransferase (adenine-specific) n=2 Tax=Campylobacter cuniculorum TaxID=374106 RepID=A0A1W6BZ15_9BACT|nr:type ISP restriction/modification enzyme [Campylobacter cuniculorum]ARJ57341.1 DNA methyltransferase/helicase [Campylobacter cuniculorum DSM 23162 = LMG 24588]QOR04776.1 N-6 DNA methylase [Campylobacter cuniculorum]